MSERVLHLSARDRIGGAARATYRIHRSLDGIGVESGLLVQRRSMDEEEIYGPGGTVGKLYDGLRRKIDHFPVLKYRNRDPELFSPAWMPDRVASQVEEIDPAIVHLHWVAGGFLTPETVQEFSRPVVWTFHDMWPFTGGCHYAKDCERYTESCGACPHLGSQSVADLSSNVHKTKRDAWADVPIHVVTPSTWLSRQAEKSSLFGNNPIVTIPNPIDTDQFRARETDDLRSQLGLSEDTLLIGTGADRTTRRKGLDLFFNALKETPTPTGRAEVVLFGRVDDTNRDDLEYDLTFTGFIDEETLKRLYAELDVLVVPSRQEAFGQTASEALASGTPVVAFNTTGPADIVTHQETGYLATPFDSADLATGIRWTLADAERRARLSERARTAAVEQFSMPTIARQYARVYETATGDLS